MPNISATWVVRRYGVDVGAKGREMEGASASIYALVRNTKPRNLARVRTWAQLCVGWVKKCTNFFRSTRSDVVKYYITSTLIQ